MKWVTISSVCALLGLSLSQLAAEPAQSFSIPIEQAASRVGYRVRMTAVVAQVTITKRGTVLLNLGGKHPNQVLTVVALGRVARSWKPEQWNAHQDKMVRIDGTITLRDGKPQVVLEDARCLEVIHR